MTAKKKSIMVAATELFAEAGYDATPVTAIARRAGVSEGAVFQHFKSKENLLREIFKRVREEFLAELDARFRLDSGESGLEMAIRLVQLYCRFHEENEVEFDFIHRNNPYRMPAAGEECREEMRRIYDRMGELMRFALTLGVRDGSVRQLDVEQAALVVLGAVLGPVRLRLFTGLHLKEIEAQVVDLVRHGLAAGASA